MPDRVNELRDILEAPGALTRGEVERMVRDILALWGMAVPDADLARRCLQEAGLDYEGRPARIRAIKLYRNYTNASLREAIDSINSVM